MTGVAQARLRILFRKSGVRRLAAVSLSALLVTATGFSTDGFARSGKVPKGMIPYDKPVYKNGRRVLYHGPSRSGGKAARVDATPGKAARAEQSRSGGAKAAAAAAPVAAAASVVEAPVRLALAMDGPLASELRRALAAKGVELTLSGDDEADLVVMAMPLGAAPPPGRDVAAIARLYDCDVAVIGAGGMQTIADLAAKRVVAAPDGTAAGRSARRLFAAAGVDVTFIEAESGAAAMAAGQADGYVVISPKPRLDDAPPGARLLSVPYAGAVRDQFLPTELGKATFPVLIDRNGVDTVAQPVVLAAVDPNRDPARRAALGRFTEAFFAALTSGALADAKWRDVNPAAKIPFSRFEAAQAWIDKARPN